MPDTKPTPTVIEIDLRLAEKWYRCMACGRADPCCPSHGLGVDNMAAEIAAAREAWGVSREAVAGLVEVAEGGFTGRHTDDCRDTPGVQTPRYPWGCGCQKRAVDLALERVREAQG